MTRRSDRIQRSLGSLSEDVVKYLSKLCRRRWNVHSRQARRLGSVTQETAWPKPLLPGFAFAKWRLVIHVSRGRTLGAR